MPEGGNAALTLEAAGVSNALPHAPRGVRVWFHVKDGCHQNKLLMRISKSASSNYGLLREVYVFLFRQLF